MQSGPSTKLISLFFQLNSLWAALKTIFYGSLFGLFAGFKCGRSLLLNYPSFFSGGAVTKEGPSKEMAEGTTFHMTLVRKCVCLAANAAIHDFYQLLPSSA